MSLALRPVPLASPAERLPSVSVVLAARDEVDSLPPLIDEIHAALAGEAYEIVVVDDGSRDGTAPLIRAMAAENPRLSAISHRVSCGQSAAIRTGVTAALADIIVTLDADGQNDPADIPRLVSALRDGHRDAPVAMVAGQRAIRKDDAIRRLSSRIANAVRGRLLKDGIRDTGCGLKVFERTVFLRLPYFDHMHRFLPALVQREGLTVLTISVNHRPRTAGRTKYGIGNRLLPGIADLAGVLWLQARTSRPEIAE